MSRLDPTQGQMSHVTNLLQLYTTNPEEAPRMISESNNKGIPLLVLVDSNNSCPVLKMNIPSGMIVLETVFGAHNGLVDEGCHVCYPCWKNVSVLISRNTVRFNAPVYDTPTKDNVLVTIDCGVNFHIGGSEETYERDGKMFFYNFGPNRLQELLQEEVDEGIRGFIKKIRVNRVRDVKTEMTAAIQQDLSEKFRPYGVVIEQVNIMKVFLPADMRYVLACQTTYDANLQKDVKLKGYRMLQIKNKENKTMLTLQRDNKAVISKLEHETSIAKIEQLIQEVANETELQRLVIAANQRRQTLTISAESIRFTAERKAKAFATKKLKEAEAYQFEKTEQAQNIAEHIRVNADARFNTARDTSAAQIVENSAESKYSNMQEGARRHKEKLSLAENMVMMAKQGRFVVQDANKDGGVLNFYSDTIDVVNKR